MLKINLYPSYWMQKQVWQSNKLIHILCHCKANPFNTRTLNTQNYTHIHNTLTNNKQLHTRSPLDWIDKHWLSPMPSVVQRAPYALWFPPNHKIIYLVYNTLSHNKNVTALQYARYRGAGKPVIHVDRCMYYGLFLSYYKTKFEWYQCYMNWKYKKRRYNNVYLRFLYMEPLLLVTIVGLLYVLSRYALRETTEDFIWNRRGKGGNL